MQQQGRFAADILYFYGEDSNLTAIFVNSASSVPAGYGFDYVNADALIHMFRAANGHITTASGMNYRLLVLDPYSKHMSLPVLRAIHSLVEQGAVVAGPKPTDTPSLADDQAEFDNLSDELFGDATGVHTLGKGKVFAGQDAASTLAALNVAPDFDHTKPAPTPASPSSIASLWTATSISLITAATSTRPLTQPSVSPVRHPSCGMPKTASWSRPLIASQTATPWFRCISNRGERSSSFFANPQQRLRAPCLR
jgi:hypothetical protein